MIKRTPQFIAFDLYVTVEAVGYHISKGSQHTNEAEELQSLLVDAYHAFAQDTPLPNTIQLCH